MKFRTARSHHPSIETSWLLERLETRTLMDGAPLPALTDLQDPTDTVVRIKTTLGDVDLELFDGVAPLTVSAFVSRIARGDIDLSFFHRLVPGQVLEGGAFKFQDGAGLFEVPAGGPVAPEMARSNVARTIAMERVDAGDGSATARFFFNLGDNSATFDNPATGFSVFGRVANDASWSVVQAIGALHTADLDVRLSGSEGTRFDNVPVVESGDHNDDGDHNSDNDDDGDHNCDNGDNGDQQDHDDDGPATQSLVDITDIEVVKAQGSSEFYTHSISYPEGFSGSTVDEFVPMANPNDQPALYQVILRFEQDPANPFSRRDSVVATGTIAPNSRGGIDVWHGMTDFPGTPDSPVTPGRPYAIEVRSTLALAATLSHYDFGVATGESFSTAPSTNWVITDGMKGSGAFDFLVWYNPTAETAHIHLTFSPNGQATTHSLDVNLGAYRRGGLNVSLLDILPEGRFATRIESSQPLVAAVSHYQPGVSGQGYTSIGASGTPATEGVIANAAFGDSIEHGTATLSFLNPGGEDSDHGNHNGNGNDNDDHGNHNGNGNGNGNDDDDHGNGDHHDDDGDDGDGAAVIGLTLRFENHDLADVNIPAALTLAPGQSGAVRLDSSLFDVTPYLGQRFTVTYTSDRAVFAGMSQSDRFDGVSTGVAVTAAMNSQFGEGFMDPARAGTEVFETVAVFNPFSASAHAGAQDAHITLTFRYTDGFVVSVNRTISGGDTAFVDLNAMPEILAQGTDNHRYFYSTQVTSDVPIVAQLTHLDTNLGRPGNQAGGFSTLGTTFGDSSSLDSL